jgi:large subunit ribosomal protein L29
MKIQEIRDMSTEELVKRIEEEEKNSVDLRFAHKLKQLTNTAKLKTTKKDIARMKTLLKERTSNEKTGEAGNKEGAEA